MQLFYDPHIQAGPHELRTEEAQHAVRVLRKRPGDVLDIIDGRGRRYKGVIEQAGKKHVLLTAALAEESAARAAHRTTLLVAPTKNIDRFEWVLEKATEIGVDRIVPILTEHSERRRIRLDRLERVVESAAKQSLKLWLPELTDLMPLADALALGGTVRSATPATAAAERSAEVSATAITAAAAPVAPAQKFLAYLGADQPPLLHNNYRPGTNVTLAIGPEGGFSPAEAALARRHDFVFVSLGPHRLRTETAALAALHTVELLNWI